MGLQAQSPPSARLSFAFMTWPVDAASVRLDQWLCAARFYKTRGLAADEVDKGRVHVNDQAAKPAKAVRVGDTVAIKRSGDPVVQVVQVLAVSKTRGSASIAQTLYAETPESASARSANKEQRRLAPEPAATITQGRPTKRDRRDMGQATERWQRWSASIDDET
jgi:ribosome-associated heat shock protein Hsp15